jgi:hypothetical protein
MSVDGHTSQSRVSDHIEMPEDNDNTTNNKNNNETTNKQDAEDNAGKRRKVPELGDRKPFVFLLSMTTTLIDIVQGIDASKAPA